MAANTLWYRESTAQFDLQIFTMSTATPSAEKKKKEYEKYLPMMLWLKPSCLLEPRYDLWCLRFWAQSLKIQRLGDRGTLSWMISGLHPPKISK